MHQLHVQKTALTLGWFVSAMHLIWSVLVAMGIGQWLMDFIFWAHMIHLPITVGPFDLIASVTLIAVTFVVGYIFGYVFAIIWNRLHQEL